MPFDLNYLRTDDDLKSEAEWLPYGGGLEVLVARHGNKHFQGACRTTGDAVRVKVTRGGEVSVPVKDVDTRRAKEKEAASKFILLDWKNMLEGGKEVAYSSEKALKIFNMSDEFYEEIIALSGQVQSRLGGIVEEAQKN